MKKKVLSVLLVAAMAFSLAACENKSESNTGAAAEGRNRAKAQRNHQPCHIQAGTAGKEG